MKSILINILAIQILIIVPNISATEVIDSNLLSKSYEYEKLSDSAEIYWKRADESEIEFILIFKSTSWLGFGLSPDGRMKNADAVVVWQNKDRTGHFSDRHSGEDGILKVDKKHDWFMIDISILNANTTRLDMKRKIMLCDSDKEDLDIRSGDIYLIFSSGQDVTSELNRQWSSKKVKLFRDEAFSCPPEPQKIVFDSKPTQAYMNHVELMPGFFHFHWNFSETDIIGEIHVKTEGWVGFGLSPNGKMDQSDVVVGWIDTSKQVNFTVI
jgi:hypothetical protein